MKVILLTSFALIGASILYADSNIRPSPPQYDKPVAHITVVKNDAGTYVYEVTVIGDKKKKKKVFNRKELSKYMTHIFDLFQRAGVPKVLWLYASREIPLEHLKTLGDDMYDLKASGIKINHGTTWYNLKP